MKLPRIIGIGLGLIIIGCSAKDGVRVWEEQMSLPTWEIGPAETNPTFAWSSTRKPVYPYPYKEIITNQKTEKVYTACWLENEYIQVLVLPEIGGRLHGAKDKTNDYNFFYWQPSIKPALIGMTGAWISGGIEWNFPHGHRPSAFSPVSHRLVENPDGSKTIWVGETEWVNRLRWTVGLTVHPGRSVIEAKVRLLNPGPVHHSYYMWATTAVNANENYQAIYPTRLMTEHGKYEYFHWPVHDGVDISWWKNIPNASSFFAVERGEFFGGYDHGRQAGTILTGDKHILIGKKLWSWGTSPFGRMWEPILTEDQGPYFEPQMGAYADNQPDNHWLEPGDIKAFSMFFYPVRDIGAFKQANVNGALNLEFAGDTVKIGVYSTEVLNPATVHLTLKDELLYEQRLDIDPSQPYVHRLVVENASSFVEDFRLALSDGEEIGLISYSPEIMDELPTPEPAMVFDEPENIGTVNELWQIGEAKSKYKKIPLRKGYEGYFLEALKRDPDHAPSHISLAEWDIKRAAFSSALAHLQQAQRRDPDNGKIFYLRAVAEEALGEYDAAYSHYFRSVHHQDYLSVGYQSIARLDIRYGNYSQAIMHIQSAIESNMLNPQLWALSATALRLSGQHDQAVEAAERALELDPINPWALNELITVMEMEGKAQSNKRDELRRILLDDPQYYIEAALNYMHTGLYEDASRLLEGFHHESGAENPLVTYYNGYCKSQSGGVNEAKEYFEDGAGYLVDYTFPFRTEAIDVFNTALRFNPSDGHAHYYLGLVYAGIGEVDQATSHWELAVELDPENARAWRNLGLVHLKVSRDLQAAMRCYTKAFELQPMDSRILLELDKVRKARGESTAERLAFLRKHLEVVESRDDLLTSMLDLMVREGEYEQALEYYRNHHFHNWEGGYSIHNAYMEANIGMSRKVVTPVGKLACYKRACEYPANLEFDPREPNLRGFLYYPMAVLYKELNDHSSADSLLNIAAEEYTSKPTLASYYQALALRELGQESRADQILSNLEREGQRLLDGDKTGYERQGDDLLYSLGHYYLSRVHDAYGRKSEARSALARAAERLPMIEREALIFAQVTYAGAHQ